MNTITDTELKVQGMDVLISALGEVLAEKFITLMNREPFDYTEWQKDLWRHMSVEDLSKLAMAHRLKTRK